jgi:hypothetical protein
MNLMDMKFTLLFRRARKPENRLPLDMDGDRYVIFSDHHKGDGSAADDFKKNAALYTIALDHYTAEDFRLLVLGDNEELWENSYPQVRVLYDALIAREVEMAPEGPEGKKIRIWGNHDKEISLRSFQWRLRGRKKDPLYNVDLREALCLGPDIFLIHGHQGRFFEDKAWRLSRWAVHFIWKTIQRLFHIGIDGPAENVEVRESLEMRYYRWAADRRVLLICGHTHRAVFGAQTYYDRLQRQIRRLQEDLEQDPPQETGDSRTQRLEAKQKERDRIRARNGGRAPRSFATPAESALPCYFNDGCCGYTNGITCLEIEKGEIRLVKWQRSPHRRIVLVRDRLENMLRHIKAGVPLPS